MPSNRCVDSATKPHRDHLRTPYKRVLLPPLDSGFDLGASTLIGVLLYPYRGTPPPAGRTTQERERANRNNSLERPESLLPKPEICVAALLAVRQAKN